MSETTMARAGAEQTSRALEEVLVQGDLKLLTPAQRVEYYQATCRSLNLNPLTKPFEYITLNGKLTLYATRTCSDQLRKLHRVSVTRLETELVSDIYVVRAHGCDADGRSDCATGAVSVKGLSGENLANALMKAETKAKRRLTLSICGLGMLDETEVDSIPRERAQKVTVDPAGEINETETTPALPPPTNGATQHEASSDRERWVRVLEWAGGKGLSTEARVWLREALTGKPDGTPPAYTSLVAAAKEAQGLGLLTPGCLAKIQPGAFRAWCQVLHDSLHGPEEAPPAEEPHIDADTGEVIEAPAAEHYGQRRLHAVLREIGAGDWSIAEKRELVYGCLVRAPTGRLRDLPDGDQAQAAEYLQPLDPGALAPFATPLARGSVIAKLRWHADPDGDGAVAAVEEMLAAMSELAAEERPAATTELEPIGPIASAAFDTGEVPSRIDKIREKARTRGTAASASPRVN